MDYVLLYHQNMEPTIDETMTYIRDQFTYLLGPALATHVRYDEDEEQWHVCRNGRHFVMQVTSDDDNYLFTCTHDNGTSITITFPFYP